MLRFEAYSVIKISTRMHSSRMRSIRCSSRLLEGCVCLPGGVCPEGGGLFACQGGCLPAREGVCLPGGVYLPGWGVCLPGECLPGRGDVCPVGVSGRHPPGQNDRCL